MLSFKKPGTLKNKLIQLAYSSFGPDIRPTCNNTDFKFTVEKNISNSGGNLTMLWFNTKDSSTHVVTSDCLQVERHN